MGFALAIPILVSLVYDDGIWKSFLISSLSSILVGGSMYFFLKTNYELRIREAFLVVSLTWFSLALVGAIPFWLSGITNGYTDAVFETMSGLTTTGSTIFGGITSDGYQNPAISALPKSLLFWRSLSHWLGGMGIIVLSIAILPLLGIGGMQLFQAEAPGPSADKLTPRVQETAKLLWVVYVVITLIEFLLLWAHPSMDWFEALNHAFATLATGGFSTQDGSVADFDSVYIDSIITVFMFLAGINFALHYRLATGEIKRVAEDRELRFYALITFLAVILISAGLFLSGTYDLGNSLRYGAFQAVAILTTTGFGTDNYEIWPAFSVFVLFLLFFTGGCAGSTGGGIKMIRWMILVRNGSREIRQIIHPRAIIPVRIGERVVEQGILQTVLSFFILYLFIFATGGLILSLLGLDLLSALGASIACLGNIGPGWGNFGPTENFAQIPYIGKWVLILLMMLGRLEVFTVLIIFAPSFWKD